jgi:integrase
MRWQDVADEGRAGTWWTIPAERHKGGREHRVPLVEAAVSTLKRLHGVTGSFDHVFPSPKPTAAAPHVSNPQKAAERLWKLAGVEGATLHDLRRTAASGMAMLKVPRLVVGKVLGHADADVTGRYDVHAYDREKRAALQKWADELERIAKAKKKRERKVLPWAQ